MRELQDKVASLRAQVSAFLSVNLKLFRWRIIIVNAVCSLNHMLASFQTHSSMEKLLKQLYKIGTCSFSRHTKPHFRRIISSFLPRPVLHLLSTSCFSLPQNNAQGTLTPGEGISHLPVSLYSPWRLVTPGDSPGSDELQADPVSLNAQPRLLIRFGLRPLSRLYPPGVVSFTVSIGKTKISKPC